MGRKHFLLAILYLFAGCQGTTQYAAVRIATFDERKGSISVRVFDASNGQVLGEGLTPADFIITKDRCENNRVMSVIVVDECYPAKWKMVKITKWTSKKKLIHQPEYLNKIEIFMTADDTCIWDIQ